MSNRTGKLDVAHTLTTYFRERHFDTTFFADNTTMLESLVLTAKTLIVLVRAKNLGAEKTITFRLERTIVDRFRLFNFAVRSTPDQIRRSESDSKRIKLF
jgi:hypothetical protein